MKALSLLVAFFLFLTTLESWAGYWLAGRWFVSSRFATVSLGTVKNWLDRGIVSGTTQTAKVLIQRNGKWILLTLGLGQVIPEVQQNVRASRYCYDPTPVSNQTSMVYLYVGSYTSTVSYSHPYSPHTLFYSLSSSCPTTSRDGSVPFYLTTYRVFRKTSNGWEPFALVGQAGTYTIVTRDRITCTANFSWTMNLQPCGSVDAWQSEKRRVPIRVFPNPADFIHPDVISQDPALSWLRDEYNRIAGDSSIPVIPADALSGVELPSVDWSIPEEEAVDSSATSSREFEGSQEGEGQVSVPGLDTKLDPVQRKPFPVELINQLVQNHPLLRILGSVGLDASAGGSCVMGSEPFIIDMCGWQWVLNLMGSFLVPLAFLYGLGIGGRGEE